MRTTATHYHCPSRCFPKRWYWPLPLPTIPNSLPAESIFFAVFSYVFSSLRSAALPVLFSHPLQACPCCALLWSCCIELGLRFDKLVVVLKNRFYARHRLIARALPDLRGKQSVCLIVHCRSLLIIWYLNPTNSAATLDWWVPLPEEWLVCSKLMCHCQIMSVGTSLLSVHLPKFMNNWQHLSIKSMSKYISSIHCRINFCLISLRPNGKLRVFFYYKFVQQKIRE